MKNQVIAVGLAALLLVGCKSPAEQVKEEFTKSSSGKEIEACYRSQGQETLWVVQDAQDEYGTDMFFIFAQSYVPDDKANQQVVDMMFVYNRATKENKIHYVGLTDNYDKPRSLLTAAISNAANVLTWCSGKKIK